MSEAEIRLERDSAVVVERLWEVLVTPSLWWGRDVRLEPHASGAFHEPWRDGGGAHHTRGKVLIWQAPHELCLSWRDDDWSFGTRVSFVLARSGQGSRLELCHGGWRDAPEHLREGLLSSHRQGWAFHLDNLVACADRDL